MRSIAQNADLYRYVVSPEVDGFPWSNFTVDANLMAVTSDNPQLGLRQTQGNDPANPTTD